MWHTLPAIVFVALALMFFYALETPPATSVAPLQTELKKAPAIEADPLIKQRPLPPLAMLPNTPVLVNFFASWCTPCVAEHALLKTLAQQQDILLYGIGWNDTAENIAAFLEKHGNPYSHVAVDHNGHTAIAYGITGVPESFLIDTQKHIVFHLRGPLTEDVIATDIIPRLETMAHE